MKSAFSMEMEQGSETTALDNEDFAKWCRLENSDCNKSLAAYGVRGTYLLKKKWRANEKHH